MRARAADGVNERENAGRCRRALARCFSESMNERTNEIGFEGTIHCGTAAPCTAKEIFIIAFALRVFSIITIGHIKSSSVSVCVCV